MELKQLRSFVSVVEQGGFSAAAESLFLSQPTISTHVRQLEEELGCELLSRTTKALELTPTGEKVLAYAKNILDLEDRIIHIGASTIPSAYILPELLARYGRLHPEIYFQVHQSDSRRVIEEFEDGLFDLAMIGVKHENAHTVCHPICTDRMVLITPANEHYLALKDEGDFPLDRLPEEPIILREHGSGSLKLADSFLAEAGIRESDLRVVARINDQEAIKQMVTQGLGVSIISERAVEGLVREKRILSFSIAKAQASRDLYLIHKKKPSGEHLEDFISYIIGDGDL